MKKIYLDGSKMTSRFEFHEYMKIKLGLSKTYGENLDALWDELSSRTDEIFIILYNEDSLKNYLGDYGLSIIDLFVDLDAEVDNIKFGMIG